MKQRKRTPFIERFFANVSPEPNSGCWLWMMAPTRRGYGMISLGGRGGKCLTASHASLFIHGVDIPHGSVVMHKCDNPACVNPDHLRVGTQKENMHDMYAKGREFSREIRSQRMLGKRLSEPKKGNEHPLFGRFKTHCIHGHEFAGDNLLVLANGRRMCRQCHREKALRYYYEKRAHA